MRGRRAFLSFMGKAAAVAPALPHVVSEQVAQNVSFGVVSDSAIGSQSCDSWTHKLSKKAFNALLRARENKADTIRLMALHRLDGCDPDIHCLRSLSPSARQRMQIRRDKAARERISEMSDILWPRDET
ncbi:MAG: hypothetical protein ACTS10_21940 [Kiloniellales bacterium]